MPTASHSDDHSDEVLIASAMQAEVEERRHRLEAKRAAAADLDEVSLLHLVESYRLYAVKLY
jgi:hypothetical protein